MSDSDLRYEKNHHSWNTYLQLTGKTDRKGSQMSDEERLAAQPTHQYWQDRAQAAAFGLRSRIGIELHREVLSSLPETADSWSPQRWAFAFERAGAHLDRLPTDQAPQLVSLVLAILASPIRPHPYAMARMKRACECGLVALPWQLDERGWEYRCDSGCRFIVQDDTARIEWEERLNAIRETLGEIK